jgi:hypothetical protein
VSGVPRSHLTYMSEIADQLQVVQTTIDSKLRPTTRLPARRKLDRLAWSLVTLALGWVGQALLAAEQLWPALLLYAVAIPVFAVQLARPDQLRLASGESWE